MNEEQMSMFDAPKARAARDDAMQTVERNADGLWIVRARATVELVARRLQEFTTDDVWIAGLDQPHEPRALGPVMRWAARRGICRATHRRKPSLSVVGHARPVEIWHSLTYRAGGGAS